MKKIIPTVKRVLDKRFQELLCNPEITPEHWETYLRVVSNYMKWSYGSKMDVFTRRRGATFIAGLSILLKTISHNSIINYDSKNDY